MQVRAPSPPSAISPSPRADAPRDRLPEDRVTRTGASPTLTAEELRLVESLRQRDVEVRAHEAAHQAAGGSLTGGASFTYETGPDGRAYAVGGEVPISMAEGNSPAETISIARRIRAAALAPADPSGQDLRVASQAAALEMRATLEQLRQPTERGAEVQVRGSHLHRTEPCGACGKATEQYASSASAVGSSLA